MKTTLSSNLAKSLVGISLVLLAGLAACGKKQPPVSPAAEISGVKVDMPKLQAAFVGAPQELQTDVNQTASSLRYGQYERALQAVDRLASNPALNDTQKKVVNEVIEQLKQLIQKAGPTRQ
jgi:hypothetical protein